MIWPPLEPPWRGDYNGGIIAFTIAIIIAFTIAIIIANISNLLYNIHRNNNTYSIFWVIITNKK